MKELVSVMILVLATVGIISPARASVYTDIVRNWYWHPGWLDRVGTILFWCLVVSPLIIAAVLFVWAFWQAVTL